ncbi:hypothetical protein K1X12_02585 [Hyphomonas sp. WL0036]|uniref:hypothetical protein n=1 Tax=Hyphomonas sediminis TaxID=2866160 RepID=UPI001C80FBB2|nr:hypothetical protein [Hyphomonas sediminis]MBY9065767.1 hypothetical protein [Hyphomonas sediminis]
MRRILWLFLCGALLAPPVFAAKPAEKAAGPDARKEELSSEFNQFVRDALDEGILAPAGSGTGAKTAPPAVGEEGALQEVVLPKPVAALDCSRPYPLDFTEFEAVSSYADILNYRTRILTDGVASADDPRLAKAYIALDLGSEAIMNLRNTKTADEQVLRQVALLLDRRMRTNVGYFEELAGCYEQAEFWLGVAQLVEGRSDGIAHLDNTFNEFRHLPLQLRTSVTALTVPTLDATGGRFLAQKMLASFSKDEVADSTQLQFATAILDLSQGSPEAEARIRAFLLQGRFQEDALFALIRHGRIIDAPVRAVLLDGMLVKIEQSQRDEDIRAGMRFVLDELSAESRYLTMLDMAGRENMQSAAAQEEIRTHFVGGVKRDLASEDPLHNLAAIEALSVEAGLLDEYAERTEIFEEATLKAVRLGFASLADQLSQKTQPLDTVTEQRATLAYRLKDYPSVYRLAAENPSSLQIGLVAALSSIEANDPAQLQSYASRLELNPETILVLIEQDAASGRWIVPQNVYDAAGNISDPAFKPRADRVLALKTAAAGDATAPEPVNLAGVSGRLMSTRMALESLEGEAD